MFIINFTDMGDNVVSNSQIINMELFNIYYFYPFVAHRMLLVVSAGLLYSQPTGDCNYQSKCSSDIAVRSIFC